MATRVALFASMLSSGGRKSQSLRHSTQSSSYSRNMRGQPLSLGDDQRSRAPALQTRSYIFRRQCLGLAVAKTIGSRHLWHRKAGLKVIDMEERAEANHCQRVNEYGQEQRDGSRFKVLSGGYATCGSCVGDVSVTISKSRQHRIVADCPGASSSRSDSRDNDLFNCYQDVRITISL